MKHISVNIWREYPKHNDFGWRMRRAHYYITGSQLVQLGIFKAGLQCLEQHKYCKELSLAQKDTNWSSVHAQLYAPSFKWVILTSPRASKSSWHTLLENVFYQKGKKKRENETCLLVRCQGQCVSFHGISKKFSRTLDAKDIFTVTPWKITDPERRYKKISSPKLHPGNKQTKQNKTNKIKKKFPYSSPIYLKLQHLFPRMWLISDKYRGI